jgi:cob(I)alamin adenosyltransferase
MKIYTKTGDDGTTALFDGSRVSKDADRVDLYGEIDEINATVGLAASFLKINESGLQENLFDVQRDLFALGARLANPQDKIQKEKSEFTEDKVTRLEKQIDDMEKFLKPMTSFILPGGVPASGALHVARTICRRAERKLVAFNKKEAIDGLYIRYLNRLSDYLFVAARYANKLEEMVDIPW